MDNSSLNNAIFSYSGNNGLPWLTDDAVLDFSLIAQHESQLHEVNLNGFGNNILNISAADVLALGHEDLFLESGMKQLMVTGDVVNIETLLGTDTSAESRNTQGQITVGGEVYDVWQDGNQQVELLIQQGMQIQQD